jgi:lipopolysaccharide assembly protein B
MLQFLFLLLPAAAAGGWYAGNKYKNAPTESKAASHLRRNYFQGLNYLINEQPDKAVDVFVKLLEVDSDTIETHLALGSLFRRKGEVDRAIRIHQNLIARPQLPKEYRLQALSELGCDYLRAGVLDRAEGLFLELVELGEQSVASLKYLLHIYQQEKDWEQAISVAHQLAQVSKESMSSTIAHYYCELCERADSKGNISDAGRYVKKAQAIDARSVRASMLKANLAVKVGDFSGAIKHYQKVVEYGPDFISEIIKPLCLCYREIGQEEKMVDYLHTCLLRYPRIAIVLELAQYLQHKHDAHMAIEFIADQIKKRPSLRGLKYLVELYLLSTHGDTEQKLSILNDFMDRLITDKPVYQCAQCGFSGSSLYWLCPSCHHWSTTKPIQGLEGS